MAHEAPQSTPISAPFFTPSLQLGGAHCPITHEPLAQSWASPQPRPSAQSAHTAPPQSTSLSAPFFSPSEQVGSVWQSPPAHEALAQSLSIAHVAPSPQAGQIAPPQSTSLSPRSPLSSPSLHVARQV
jgi:hypothetical protein